MAGTPLNHVIGDRELCAWQPVPGITWVQTRDSKHAQRMSRRSDSKVVVVGAAGKATVSRGDPQAHCDTGRGRGRTVRERSFTIVAGTADASVVPDAVVSARRIGAGV